MIYLLMIYDFSSPCCYSVAPYDYQFCITIAFTRLVGVLLFVFLFSPRLVLLCMHFNGVPVGISTCLLSRFIAMMQMRVCKDRMALGLYL